MMTSILETGVNILQYVVNIVTTPINSLISTYFPQISSGFDYINDFFDMILGLIPWIMSWFNLPDLFIELIIGYWVFKLTVPYLVHAVKIAVAWWDSIIA